MVAAVVHTAQTRSAGTGVRQSKGSAAAQQVKHGDVVRRAMGRVKTALGSKLGQGTAHFVVGAAVSSAAAAGVTACVAGGCEATAVAMGFWGLVALGTSADYAISNRQNRQKGVTYWGLQSFESATKGAVCGILFETGCLAASKSAVKSAWGYISGN